MQLCEFRVKHACAFSVWRILFFCAGNWRISRKLIEFGLVHMQGMDVSRKTILIWTLCSKSRFLGIKTNCLRFSVACFLLLETPKPQKGAMILAVMVRHQKHFTNSWHSDPRDIIMVKCVTYWIFLV